MALWQWLFTRVEPQRNRVKSQLGKSLGELLDAEKKTRPAKLARSRKINCSQGVVNKQPWLFALVKRLKNALQ